MIHACVMLACLGTVLKCIIVMYALIRYVDELFIVSSGIGEATAGGTA